MSTTPPVRQPFAPADDPRRVTGEEMAEQAVGKTVTMVFPRPVLLSTQDGRRVEFREGVQEVPVELANHTWLQLNGVKKYEKSSKSAWMRSAPPPTDITNAAMTDLHVNFLRSRGYTNIRTVADAQAFFTGLDPQHKAGFLEEASEFQSSGQALRQMRVQAGEAGYTDAPEHPGDVVKPILPQQLRRETGATATVPGKPGQPGAPSTPAGGPTTGGGAASTAVTSGTNISPTTAQNAQRAADQHGTPIKNAQELNAMGKPDLIAYAKSQDIAVDPASKKEDIVAAIMASPHNREQQR